MIDKVDVKVASKERERVGKTVQNTLFYKTTYKNRLSKYEQGEK
jgi:hypothetical protein